MARSRRPATYHHGNLADTAVASAIAALDADGVLPSLRTLADRCGVTHTALYRHFDDLDALGLAVATRCYQEIAAAMRTSLVAARTPEARFRAIGIAYMRWGLDHPGRYLFMTSAAFANRTAHAPFVAAARAAFEPLVATVAALGVADPLPAAHTVVSATHGMVDMAVKGRSIPDRAEPLNAQIDRMLAAMLAYVQSEARTGRRARVTRKPSP